MTCIRSLIHSVSKSLLKSHPTPGSDQLLGWKGRSRSPFREARPRPAGRSQAGSFGEMSRRGRPRAQGPALPAQRREVPGPGDAPAEGQRTRWRSREQKGHSSRGEREIRKRLLTFSVRCGPALIPRVDHSLALPCGRVLLRLHFKAGVSETQRAEGFFKDLDVWRTESKGLS